MPKPLFRDDTTGDPENRYFLERPRIDSLLTRAMQSHVVAVVAGEGSGKTHAVNSFLQRDSRGIIWVQLSQRDNLGWRFWENYTGEVARLNPEAAKIFLDMGFPESERQFERYLGLLKSEIISQERYVIVFDDFHLLTNPSVLLHLGWVLSAPVSRNTIVFISRTEPAINTVGLLAKGLLSRVTAEDLRFTREEVGEYFRLRGVPLDEGELARVYHETEGWALTLGLILQEMRRQKAGRRDWDRVMLPVRKMEENIFAAMDGELQKFLIKLSLFEHWPRNLLERLDPGGRHIAAMEKISSVIRFDVYLHSFQIHHLFLDFLREKQEALSQEEIRDAAVLGAQWCVENGLPTDAAVDYERARDYGGFVRLIESLPRVLPGTMASFFLETAERMIAENPDDGENWDFVYLRFIIHSRLLAVLARFEEASEECREAMARFEAHEPGPNRSRILCAAYNNLGILSVLSVRYTRDYTFVRWFERAYRHYLEHPEPVQGQTTQGNIGSYVIPVGVAVDPGEIDVFLDAYSAAIPYISACLGGYRFGTDTLARAELAYYQGNLNKAERFARQAVYQGRQKKQCEVETRALLYLMRICIHTGGIAGIRELERQMSAQLENQEYLNRYNVYDLTMGRFYSRLGLMDRIAPWLRMEHVEGELNVLSRGFDTLVKARCLFVEKDYPAALLALEEERERGDLGSYLLGFLEMTALEAVTLYRIGDREGAYAALKKAYDAARPNGLVMPFIELGEHMAGLVNAVLKTRAEGKSATGGGEEIPRDWLLAIRSSASVYAKKRFLVLAQYAGRDGAASADFSQHELAILGGLSRGRTAEEIADDMRISVNMVKSVIRSLYAKLGAINRADAIRIATAKGLL